MYFCYFHHCSTLSLPFTSSHQTKSEKYPFLQRKSATFDSLFVG